MGQRIGALCAQGFREKNIRQLLQQFVLGPTVKKVRWPKTIREAEDCMRKSANLGVQLRAACLSVGLHTTFTLDDSCVTNIHWF